MATTLWLLRVIFAQAVVICYPGVFVFWFLIHTWIEHWRTSGRKAYWVAIGAWAMTIGPLLYFRKEIFSVQWPLPDWLLWAGIVALFVALAIGFQASKVISHSTLVGLPEIEPQKNSQPLMNTGIYSRTRNPIYLAHWLAVFAAAAVTNFAANWVMFALDCVVLPLMIRAEERELRGRYGAEFTAYMRRVPRFFPKVT